MSSKNLCAVLLAVVLCVVTLAGCSSEKGSNDAAEPAGTEQEQTFWGTDLGASSTAIFSFPYLGFQLEIPESLGARMDRGELLCQASEHIDNGQIEYAFLWWDAVPPEAREQTFTAESVSDGSLSAWLQSLERVGTIGVFRSDLEDQIPALTGCDTAAVLSTSGDYQYVLTLRDAADPETAEELRQTAASAELSDMVPFDGESAFDIPKVQVTDLGAFTTETIAGEAVTESIFQGHRLTLVNLFATWCSPCVKEIPELDELAQSMAAQGVQVIGVVLDTRDSSGNLDEEALEKARLLQERTGVSYPFLIPDEGLMNGRLAYIDAVPETFFVDETGRIVGETYVGARDLNGWTQIAEATLAALEGGS